MRVALWSSNYAPEPTGIGPLATSWARGLAERGHDVTVLTAHPHYPAPVWRRPRGPYRQRDGDVSVLRVPLRVGRTRSRDRVLQDVTFSASCAAVAPLLPPADVVVAATPSFPALGVAALHAKLRRTPFVVRIHDILPDGAVATGLLDDGRMLDAMRWYERQCYRAADRVVVISAAARRNILEKGVPTDRIEHIPDPATLGLAPAPRVDGDATNPVVFTMGNIGLTQNLVEVVRAFQADDRLAALKAELVIAGDGVEGAAVRDAIASPRVRVTGILGSDALAAEMRRATVALVSQTSPGVEFNMPSKLMNFLAGGLAVVAAVRPDSEVARVIDGHGAGRVVDADRVGSDLADALVAELEDPAGRAKHAASALSCAERVFVNDRVLDRWESLLIEVA